MSNIENAPKVGDGWEGFLDDDEEIWHEAFETEEVEGEVRINADAYDEFDNIAEIVNFVAGTGTYEDTRPFETTPQDTEDIKRELKNDVWRIPEKMEEIEEYMDEGFMRSETNIDPNAEIHYAVNEEDAEYIEGEDTLYTFHFNVSDPDEDGNDRVFYMNVSWYGDEPEEMNLEDAFDLENI